MTDDTTLRIERVIDAPPDAVFWAWTTPAAMEEWYKDGPDHVVRVVEHELRVGGRTRIEFGPPGEAPYVETGEYLEVDPPHRIVLVGGLAGPDQEMWSDTRVTVVFEEEDGKTRLVLVHEHFPSKDARDGAAGGWPNFIDRLERLVTRR